MKSIWKIYHGKKMLYCDYRNFGMDAESIAREIAAVEKEILSRPEATVLTILDMSGTIGTPEIVKLFKGTAFRTRKHVLKNAVLGLTGIQKFLAESISRVSGQNFQMFQNEREAAEWLAGQ